MTSSDVSRTRATFRELHQSGCFVLPNPWDSGSARMRAGLGFKALSTTSSGDAWSCGRADGQPTRTEVLTHLRTVVEASDLPINVDFEGGFAELGVRLSLGGALARAAWGGLMQAARSIAEEGRFDGFSNAPLGSDLKDVFRRRGQPEKCLMTSGNRQ